MHFCEVNALRRLSGLACPGLSASPHVFHDGLVRLISARMTSAYHSQLSCFFPLPWAELSIVSYAAPPLVCMHACWLIATAMKRCMLAELTYVRLQLMSKKGVCCWVAMQILGRSLDIMSSPEILLPRRPVIPESKSQTLTSA